MDDYLKFKITGDFQEDIKVYFLKYDKQDVYGHTLNVIEELYNIQQQFGYIEEVSEVACYCHDLGRVVQNNHIIRFCIENNIHICEEEKQVPSILHQKVSAFIAEKVFNIKNRIILEAIGYHTTSKKILV